MLITIVKSSDGRKIMKLEWDQPNRKNIYDAFHSKNGKELRDTLIAIGYDPNSYVDLFENYKQPNPELNCHLANEHDAALKIVEAFPELDPNLKDYEGKTALIMAVKMFTSKAEKVAIALLEQFKDKVDINAQDKWGCTALHYACAYKNKTLALKLIQNGANPFILDLKKRNPLQLLTLKESSIRARLISVALEPNRDFCALHNSEWIGIENVIYSKANLEIYRKHANEKIPEPDRTPASEYIAKLEASFIGKSLIEVCMERFESDLRMEILQKELLDAFYNARKNSMKTSTIGPVIISLSGTTLLEKEKELLANPKVGGLVLFRENYNKTSDNAKELLKKLIDEIRTIHPNILIMVDHEGGKIWRFEKGFTRIPSHKTFGQMYDQNKEPALKFAFEQGKIMASELLECGVDMSLAPVLDLDGNSHVIGKYERAFHRDPNIVALLAEQFINGMNEAGMPATAKHFPGHGSCVLDSHTTKPVDARPLNELERDMHPFKTLVEKRKISGIMSAHVTYPAVDPNHPAVFSSVWIKDILRNKWGFNGAVMTDCMNMEGANIGTTLDKFKAAGNAGCDFLMLTHQHGPKLDLLLHVLNTESDNIPDTKESLERREILAYGFKLSDVAPCTKDLKALLPFVPENTQLVLGYLYHSKNRSKQKMVDEVINKELFPDKLCK